MDRLFWNFGIPSLSLFAANLFYSRALLVGIASARNQEHRLTPESSWYFFMFEFKPKAIRIAIGLLPWLSCGALLSSHEVATRLNPGLNYYSYVFGEAVRRLLPQIVFMASLSFTTITLVAPRFAHPASLAGLAAFGSFLTVFIPYQLWRKGVIPLYLEFIGVLTVAGLMAFFLSWLYVRFKLDRAWFRFDD